MALTVLPNIHSSSKAFVSFLVRQRILKSGFEQVLAGKELFEIDQYIISRNLATQESLAKSYAQFYGLPFIRLANMPIQPNVTRLLPLDVARKYMVVVYQLQGVNLKIAIGEPARLQLNAPSMLVVLRKQKGLNVELTIAPRADVEAVLRKLSSLQQVPPTQHIGPPKEIRPEEVKQVVQPEVNPVEEKPVERPLQLAKPEPEITAQDNKDVVKEVEKRVRAIDLSTVKIPKDILYRIPFTVAKQHKLIVFAEEPSKSQFEPPLIKIAFVNPDDPHVREIVSYIESRNKVLVERYKVDLLSFEQTLKQYDESKIESTVPIKSEETESLQKQPAFDREEKPPILEDLTRDLTRPEIKVTTEEERSGQTQRERTDPTLAPEIPGVTEGLSLSSNDIIARPSTEESPEELKRLAAEQANSLEGQDLDKLLKGPVDSVDELAKIFKSGVIPEIVAGTLFLAIRMKASDVHIEAQETSVRLRFRIDGILHDVIRVPHFLHAPLISRIKILAKMKIDEQRIPQDGRFDVIVDTHQVDLRVSTLPTVYGEKIVMRLLDKSSGIYSLEQLGVTGTNFDTLVANISKPYGVILATGPTGSGKSTTLYAILQRVSKPGVNIITLEDPVEYELPGINQSQVKPQIGFTFAEGLRSVLRQDPNVIMVGEIRDLETAAMATHAALTGHLVLSSLHTNDASGALPRLINMGVEPFLITSSINAVVGQRLVRRICDKCRDKANIPPAILAHIKRELAAIPSGQMKNINLESLVFYHGKGCKFCNNGYVGRIGIYEVLAMNEQIEELAVKKAPSSEIKKAAIKAGMITMTQDGLIKALKGITTVDEVMRVTTTEIKEVPGLEA